jgi:hypothetical protein
MNNQEKVSKITDKNVTIHILDYGQNSFWYWNSKDSIKRGKLQDAEKVSEEFVLSLPNTLDKSNHVILSEVAHFSPRTRKSKAQPLTATNLLDFSEILKEKDIDLFLFSQDITPKFLQSYRECVDPEAEKGDSNDPKYLYWNIMKDPNVITGTTTIPERMFEEPTIEDKRNGIVDSDTKSFFPQKVRDIKTYRKRVNSILNSARMNEYSVVNPEEDPNTKWLLDNYEEIKSNLSESTRNVLGFIETDNVNYPRYIAKTGTIKWTDEFKHISVLTVLGCIRDNIADEWMTLNNDKFASNKFIKNNILGLRTRRKCSGTARSNIFYWTFRFWIDKYCLERNVMLSCKSKTEKNKNGKPKQVKISQYALSDQDRAIYKQGRKLFGSSLMELYSVIRNIAYREIQNGANYSSVLSKEGVLV